MRLPRTPRQVLVALALTTAWCGLWGGPSFANIAGGLVLSILFGVSGIGSNARGSIRLLPFAQMAGLIALDLVRSTVAVAAEILTPTDYTDESIVAVPLPRHAREHLLLLVLAITLTPGTAVVDVDHDEPTLYLHLLHHSRRGETIEHTLRLAELAHQALPTSTTRAEAH